ncbi:MAG: hypothetical protein II816_03390, partial [Elusimicrobia bacterium]|nr:hypothetical protein [Elusimicrobiota bacterium]
MFTGIAAIVIPMALVSVVVITFIARWNNPKLEKATLIAITVLFSMFGLTSVASAAEKNSTVNVNEAAQTTDTEEEYSVDQNVVEEAPVVEEETISPEEQLRKDVKEELDRQGVRYDSLDNVIWKDGAQRGSDAKSIVAAYVAEQKAQMEAESTPETTEEETTPEETPSETEPAVAPTEAPATAGDGGAGSGGDDRTDTSVDSDKVPAYVAPTTSKSEDEGEDATAPSTESSATGAATDAAMAATGLDATADLSDGVAESVSEAVGEEEHTSEVDTQLKSDVKGLLDAEGLGYDEADLDSIVWDEDGTQRAATAEEIVSLYKDKLARAEASNALSKYGYDAETIDGLLFEDGKLKSDYKEAIQQETRKCEAREYVKTIAGTENWNDEYIYGIILENGVVKSEYLNNDGTLNKTQIQNDVNAFVASEAENVAAESARKEAFDILEEFGYDRNDAEQVAYIDGLLFENGKLKSNYKEIITNEARKLEAVNTVTTMQGIESWSMDYIYDIVLNADGTVKEKYLNPDGTLNKTQLQSDIDTLVANDKENAAAEALRAEVRAALERQGIPYSEEELDSIIWGEEGQRGETAAEIVAAYKAYIEELAKNEEAEALRAAVRTELERQGITYEGNIDYLIWNIDGKVADTAEEIVTKYKAYLAEQAYEGKIDGLVEGLQAAFPGMTREEALGTIFPKWTDAEGNELSEDRS